MVSRPPSIDPGLSSADTPSDDRRRKRPDRTSMSKRAFVVGVSSAVVGAGCLDRESAVSDDEESNDPENDTEDDDGGGGDDEGSNDSENDTGDSDEGGEDDESGDDSPIVGEGESLTGTPELCDDVDPESHSNQRADGGSIVDDMVEASVLLTAESEVDGSLDGPADSDDEEFVGETDWESEYLVVFQLLMASSDAGLDLVDADQRDGRVVVDVEVDPGETDAMELKTMFVRLCASEMPEDGSIRVTKGWDVQVLDVDGDEPIIGRDGDM